MAESSVNHRIIQHKASLYSIKNIALFNKKHHSVQQEQIPVAIRSGG